MSWTSKIMMLIAAAVMGMGGAKTLALGTSGTPDNGRTTVTVPLSHQARLMVAQGRCGMPLSHDGAKLVRVWEDCSARYADGWSWDNDGPVVGFRR